MYYRGKISDNIKEMKIEEFIEWGCFLAIIIVLLKINTYSNLFFHTSIELFIQFIFLLVFVFAFNTYSLNRNNFLLILGIGYFFVAVFGIFHLFTYPGMPFFSYGDSMIITAQMGITSRYLGVLTNLISIIFILKPYKKINSYIIFGIYFCLGIFLLLSILLFKLFPICYIGNLGYTSFNIISEYIMFTILMISTIIYSKFRKRMDVYLFICLECFFLLSGIAELFFASYINASDYTNIIGHIIKILAAYFLYKGVVETGLKRPYNLINNGLNVADNKVKLFEEIITQNEQCCNLLINNSDNAIFVFSNDKLVFANKRMAELLGAEHIEDIIGLDISRIITKESKKLAYQIISNPTYNAASIPFTETRLFKLDGKIIDVEVINCFCMYKGKPSLMSMFRDIAQRKQIQILKNDILENKKIINKTTENNRMMAEFFSNISHELKTPLNVILGAIQLLSLPNKGLGNNSPELLSNKYLKSIQQNCYRLVRLVNNLIDISKFDSGYFRVDLHNYNIISVVEDITLSVVDYANNKGIELLFDTDIEEKNMAIDLDKIERIILNLLSNAIKFTDEGGQIVVRMWDKGDRVLISIKDNGVGIPKDKLDMIFERFGQVDKTLVRNKEGSGIGLSLVKSIVDMHGGNIRVISEFEKGSEFIIELPVRIVKKETPTSNSCLYENKIEKISIEFSDIYS